MGPMMLEVFKSRPVAATTWAKVERAFERWDTLSRGVFVLKDGAGGYVQTAGASYKATVEYRQARPGGGFRHYVLGRADGGREPTSIYTCAGTVRLRENEVLGLAEVLEIFRAFYETGEVPERFEKRDDTARFE